MVCTKCKTLVGKETILSSSKKIKINNESVILFKTIVVPKSFLNGIEKAALYIA